MKQEATRQFLNICFVLRIKGINRADKIRTGPMSIGSLLAEFSHSQCQDGFLWRPRRRPVSLPSARNEWSFVLKKGLATSWHGPHPGHWRALNWPSESTLCEPSRPALAVWTCLGGNWFHHSQSQRQIKENRRREMEWKYVGNRITHQVIRVLFAYRFLLRLAQVSCVPFYVYLKEETSTRC